jgi:hypothetical protein
MRPSGMSWAYARVMQQRLADLPGADLAGRGMRPIDGELRGINGALERVANALTIATRR